MQLQATLFTLLALVAVFASAATWNDQLKVWNIGRVDTQKNPGRHSLRPMRTAMACGDIPEGGFVCGSFEDEGVDAPRAIYSCRKGMLQLREVCYESEKYNRCVKNGRRRGKRFFPFTLAERIVCQMRKNVEKP